MYSDYSHSEIRETTRNTKIITFSRFFITRQGFDCCQLLLHVCPAQNTSARALSGGCLRRHRQTERTPMVCSKPCSKTHGLSHTLFLRALFHLGTSLPLVHWGSLSQGMRGGCVPWLERPGHHTPSPAQHWELCHLNTGTHHDRRWVLYSVAIWMENLFPNIWC